MIAAYQGIAGAFGHQACRLAFPDAQALACPTFADVIRIVGCGDADGGVLPVENHYAGVVEGVAALIDSSDLVVERLVALPVELHLLALPNARLEDIRTVISHPMALRQCHRNLTRLSVDVEDAPNTAIAAAALRDPYSAALASELAADLYGLDILMRDLQDDPDNRTTFAVLRCG
nr:prephenate dehydratase domain-containing protein [uncultured Sphingomonas sp.]